MEHFIHQQFDLIYSIIIYSIIYIQSYFSALKCINSYCFFFLAGDRQPKRNFSLEQLERSAASDIPASTSSSSLFSSLSPPPTSSSPLHLISSLPFPLPVSKEEKEEEEMDEDEEGDDEDFGVEVIEKPEEPASKEAPKESDDRGENRKKPSPSKTFSPFPRFPSEMDKFEKESKEDQGEELSPTEPPAATSLDVEPSSPGASESPSLRFHSSKLQTFSFAEEEVSREPPRLTSTGEDGKGSP